MDIEFKNEDLNRLETDAGFTAGHEKGIVKAYRKRMQVIPAAADKRDLYAIRGNHFEKLKGNRAYQLSKASAGPQSAIRERAKLFESAPVKDMERRGWIKASTTIEGLRTQLSSFFSLPEVGKLRVAARTSIQSSELNPEQVAWCV